MISICWACSIRFAVISSTRPVSLAIARSTTRNRLAGHLCRSVLPLRSIGYGRRGVAGGIIISSAAFSVSPWLAALCPSFRLSDTASGSMMSPGVFIYGRYRWRRAASHVRGRLLFRYDPALVCLRRSAPLFACSIRETGRGLSFAFVPLSVVSRGYPRCSGR